MVWRRQPPLGPGPQQFLHVPSPDHPSNPPQTLSSIPLNWRQTGCGISGTAEGDGGMQRSRGERDGPELGWRWLPRERRVAEARRRLSAGTIKARRGQTRSEVAKMGSSGPGKCGSCGAQRQEQRRTLERRHRVVLMRSYSCRPR